MMTLYYQIGNKMRLLVAKVVQKTFLMDISVIPGSHFKFRPLEKNADIFGRNLGLILLGMVPGTQFHHQNTLAGEWSRNCGIWLYYIKPWIT